MPAMWKSGTVTSVEVPKDHARWLIARAAEEAGFEAIFCTEVNNDSVATAQLMGLATRHIKVGTWVADIYLRVPYLCAKSAIIAADATGGSP